MLSEMCSGMSPPSHMNVFSAYSLTRTLSLIAIVSRKIRSFWAASAAISFVLLQGCASLGQNSIAGQVLDSETGLPHADAYVLALYNRSSSTWGGHSGSVCMKTKGMYTGRDGRFSFPAEAGLWVQLESIKPGYTSDVTKRLRSGPEYPNLFLRARLDRDKGRIAIPSCIQAREADDLLANIQYLRIETMESVKFNYEFAHFVSGSLDDIEEEIEIKKSRKDKGMILPPYNRTGVPP